MQYLPINIRLQGAAVTLVGGGSVATRKARLLLKAGAKLTVIAPLVCDELRGLLEQGKGQWQQRAYQQGDLAGATIVVAATNDSAVNKAVHDEAVANNTPVNVVDTPDLCTFIFPSIVDRSPLVIAVSSSGSSPVLARLWRRKVEAMIPAAYGRLADWAGSMRGRVKAAIPEETARRLFWENTVEGTIADLVLSGNEAQAQAQLEASLAQTQPNAMGEVYLIGAGPGDPDLMTFKALRLLQHADVVLYDRLVAPEILDMARRDAERIYVGKQRADHAMDQKDINQLLADLAKQGKHVARLKGGDPFIFGRGGEEIELLAEQGVPFQVVPGITAASGAASYAGIPLTHRDHAQSVRFVTGHLKDGTIDHDWSQFQLTTETLVFYMGLVGLPVICQRLIESGRSPDTPVALVEKASTREQRVIIGTLATMEDIVGREQPKAPTLTIVGNVVGLQEKLAWFGKRAGS
jgi:uroporphyrin-III C-methyltransferase / precorrin-2 dehydrogenase / sirohydrochlorin ferrochelatase